MAETPAQGKPPFLRSAAGIAFLVFAGVAGFFLVTEHRAHLWGILPFLLLLVCPLMHFFMHHGHGGHGGHGGQSGEEGDPHAAHRHGGEQ
jgi:Protein of unknown function (DUF2933)